MSNHDKRGRFTNGNRAGCRPKRRRKHKNAVALIDRADELLRSIGQGDVDEQAGRILAALIAQARNGDTRAGTWLIDRLYPPGRVFLRERLPSPSADPVGYLDALAQRVSDGEVSVDQASKLANLVRPVLADAELLGLRAQVAELLAIVERLESTRVQVAK